MEHEFKQYRRTQIAEMADWEPGFDMTDVSVSAPDKAAGSPKLGDKIARNPANYVDKWLVAKAYFEANFAAVASSAPTTPIFTLEEVDSLNEYQLSGVMHPFTCQCGCDLVATVRGWICCKCDYTQNWAHEWMKNRHWKKIGAETSVADAPQPQHDLSDSRVHCAICEKTDNSHGPDGLAYDGSHTFLSRHEARKTYSCSNCGKSTRAHVVCEECWESAEFSAAAAPLLGCVITVYVAFLLMQQFVSG